jgi:hypothetical protein
MMRQAVINSLLAGFDDGQKILGYGRKSNALSSGAGLANARGLV